MPDVLHRIKGLGVESLNDFHDLAELFPFENIAS